MVVAILEIVKDVRRKTVGFQGSSGSDSMEDCKCVSGYTGSDGGTCEACVAGKYKNGIGSVTCIDCRADQCTRE